MDKFEGRWFHCLSCDSVSIRCDYCGESSCNGGGCDKCHEDFLKISEMTEDQLPKRKGLPKKSGGIQIILNAATEAPKEGISIDQWIKREHQKLIDSVIAKRTKLNKLS